MSDPLTYEEQRALVVGCCLSRKQARGDRSQLRPEDYNMAVRSLWARGLVTKKGTGTKRGREVCLALRLEV